MLRRNKEQPWEPAGRYELQIAQCDGCIETFTERLSKRWTEQAKDRACEGRLLIRTARTGC